MKSNVGKIDGIFRLTLATTLIVLSASDIIPGKGGLIALIIAIVLILTSLFSFCPLYPLFGISTVCKVKK